MTRDPHDPERRSKKYRVAFLLLLWSVPAAFAVGERYVFDADGVAAPTKIFSTAFDSRGGDRRKYFSAALEPATP